MALAIDQRARPDDALAFAETLRDGARGVAPAGADSAQFATSAATRFLGEPGDETAATRVTPASRRPRTAQTRAAPRQVEPRRAPRRVEAGRPVRAAAPMPRRAQRPRLSPADGRCSP